MKKFYLLLLAALVLGGCKDSDDSQMLMWLLMPKPGPVSLDKDSPLVYAKAGEPYRLSLGISGGSGRYLFSLPEGAKMPAGLTLESNGVISGRLAAGVAPGDYGFKVNVRDAAPGGEKYTDSSSYVITVDNRPFEWTVVAHFAVDNDISRDMEREFGPVSNYLATLEKVKAADKENRIRMVLLLDGEKSSKFKDGYYYLSGGKIEDDLVKPMTEFNSGDPAVSEAFMDWAIKDRTSSKRYLYTIFNHGGGFDDISKDGVPPAESESYTGAAQSIGNDESHSADSLSHHELERLTAYLKSLTGQKIDLFYTYACLMGGVELAYEVRENADYLLFSEESFPADKWSYEALSALVKNPAIPVADLGRAFCDSSYDYFFKLDGGVEFTLSLADLSKMDALYTAIDDYAGAALSDIGSERARAARYNRAAHESFSMLDYDIPAGQSFYYMDLVDYLDRILTADGISAAVKTEAAKVKTAFNESLVYERHLLFDEAKGMYIFHNVWDGGSPLYSPETYADILRFGSNRWTDYQKKLLELK